MNMRIERSETPKFKFNLGSEVKDIITGFTGVVMARTEYLTGCNRYAVQNRKLEKNSNPSEWATFDEMQIELVKEEKVKLEKAKEPGGYKPPMFAGHKVSR